MNSETMPDFAPGPRSAYVLVGPTASGKTAIAHVIARREGCAIVSADSMQIYRGLDAGTAKPTPEERGGIAYIGLDIADPARAFSVWEYVRAVRAEIRRTRAALLVTGGSGLYVKCLLQGIAETPSADTELRERYAALAREQGVAALAAELRRVDPERWAVMSGSDRANSRRLIRALEVRARPGAEAPRTWGAGWSARGGPSIVGLAREPEDLKDRIRRRAGQMFAGDILREAERLAAAGATGVCRQAIGYREAAAVLRGELSVEQAVERTCTRSWQLARKQMTWFRHQANVSWVVAARGEPDDSVADRVWSALRAGGAAPLVTDEPAAPDGSDITCGK